MSDLIRIVIADDHPFVRENLARLLELTEEMAVVGEAPDGAAAIEVVAMQHPDVVLMDYTMPRMNGVEATRRIRAEHPEVRVIGLSMHDDGPVETAMLEAGAAAFLSKDGCATDLLPTIRELAESGGR